MNYCPECGNQLFHTGTFQTQEAEKKLKEKMKYHCDGCSAIGFKKEDIGKRHCDIGMITGPK